MIRKGVYAILMGRMVLGSIETNINLEEQDLHHLGSFGIRIGDVFISLLQRGTEKPTIKDKVEKLKSEGVPIRNPFNEVDEERKPGEELTHISGYHDTATTLGGGIGVYCSVDHRALGRFLFQKKLD